MLIQCDERQYIRRRPHLSIGDFVGDSQKRRPYRASSTACRPATALAHARVSFAETLRDFRAG